MNDLESLKDGEPDKENSTSESKVKSFNTWVYIQYVYVTARNKPKSVTTFNQFTFFWAHILSNQKLRIAIHGL